MNMILLLNLKLTQFPSLERKSKSSEDEIKNLMDLRNGNTS